MANIWRRVPSLRLKLDDLVKDRPGNQAHVVAVAFWEYTPPSGNAAIFPGPPNILYLGTT